MPESDRNCGTGSGTQRLTPASAATRHHRCMRSVIARLAGGDITVESLVVDVAGRAHHRYRVNGGPDDGLEFDFLTQVSEYLIRVQAVA